MEETPVLIIGFGPTGALLSGYLGNYNVPHIVLERDQVIATDPRGISLDDEGIRYMQGLRPGTYEKLWTEVGSRVGMCNFISLSEKVKDIYKPPFLSEDGSAIGPTGHPAAMVHSQPALEKCIRDVVSTHSSTDVRLGCTVIEMEEDDSLVYVTYLDKLQNKKQVRAKFAVGCDGKTGFVRKQYLEPRGVLLEVNPKFDYAETWVAMNLHITLPTPATHPDFPLFSQGFTSSQIYDTFFPPGFSFLCDPSRSAVCGRFGIDSAHTWRFEFVVHPDEDGQEMAKRGAETIMMPYLIHSGAKYSLKEDVAFPRDCINVLRSRPYIFSARSCTKWALNRTIVAGDAAHVFPPYGGQGIPSGMRDSIALAWRLALLCRPNPPPYEPLLEGWYLERKQQFERSLETTLKNDQFLNMKGPVKILVRDWALWGISMLPPPLRIKMKRILVQYKQNSDAEKKYPFVEEMGGGKTIPQVLCTNDDGQLRFTDDVIFGASGKMGIFRLLVLVDSLQEIEAAAEELRGITSSPSRSNGLLSAGEATYLITSSASPPKDKDNVFRIVSKEELDAKKAEEMKRYDETIMRRETTGKYIILRPDRFTFAACLDVTELGVALEELERMFNGKKYFFGSAKL